MIDVNFSTDPCYSSTYDDSDLRVLVKWQRWLDSVATEMEEGNFFRAIDLLRTEIPLEDSSYDIHGLPGALVELIRESQVVLLAICYEKTGQFDLALEQAKLVCGSVNEIDDSELAYIKGDSIDLDTFRKNLEEEALLRLWLSRYLEDLSDYLDMIHDQTEAVEEAAERGTSLEGVIT